MSYILDALKKSDMQARQGELPSIHSSHAPVAPTRRPGWHYALFGGTAAALLLGISWLLAGKPGQPSNVRPAPHPVVSGPAAPIHPASTAITPPPMPSPPATIPSPQPNTPETAPTQATAASTAPSSQTTIPLLAQLPLDVQQALPRIDISGHIYDKSPAVRMVFVNGRIAHEGDTVAPGVRLLAIIPDGVEMSFRNHRFRIRMFGAPHTTR